MITSFIQPSHQKACIQAIQELVAFPSVLQENQADTPFGRAIQDVLEYTLDMTEQMGFKTYLDPEGYYGYAEIGQGEELLAILCHLDVVPAGDLRQWQTPPFEAVIQGDHIIGRGVQDDKGPSMAALFAVKALLDTGVQFKKRVRFIFGTDEETLWRCMSRYNQLEEVATMGFAPDSSFPLTYAEKGLLQAKLLGPGHASLSVEAGTAYNVVPAKASYSGHLLAGVISELNQAGFEYETQEDQVTVLGISRHSKDAAEGINAIVRLAKALERFESHPTLDFIVHAIGEDATGFNLFGNISDEPSGTLSFNIAGLSINAKKSEIRLDIRIPVTADKEALVSTLQAKAQACGLIYEEYDYLPSLYVPLDSQLVSTLMSVYQAKTGDLISQPISSGGATFARTMPNCVAFGACFPGTEQTEHQENERMPLEDLYKTMDIYAEAIYRLAAE
ncbi:dipeptidase [Streptococcus sp. NLN76]|uniref:dipeptidase n=1 Tax=Streptococcus sp. NLN76 TaxID=2822800 RepID=UPI0018AA2FB0|nr:dipeptidase [Streptococcus sp. NLN76]MBF8970294.1 dipeptidase [Streptococcus sp. NLN76]